MAPTTLAELLAMEGVHEELAIRSTFGFMAFHGGGLEAVTDTIARAAAEEANASYYGVLHPDNDPPHLPSTRIQNRSAHLRQLCCLLRSGDIESHFEE